MVLRVRAVPRGADTEGRRLLRLLLVRHCAMSADPGTAKAGAAKPPRLLRRLTRRAEARAVPEWACSPHRPDADHVVPRRHGGPRGVCRQQGIRLRRPSQERAMSPLRRGLRCRRTGRSAPARFRRCAGPPSGIRHVPGRPFAGAPARPVDRSPCAASGPTPPQRGHRPSRTRQSPWPESRWRAPLTASPAAPSPHTGRGASSDHLRACERRRRRCHHHQPGMDKADRARAATMARSVQIRNVAAGRTTAR